jgi:hypothetical protein
MKPYRKHSGGWPINHAPATFGAPNETEALRMSLLTMVESYDRLMAVMPNGTTAQRLAAGSFGKAPEVARLILGLTS